MNTVNALQEALKAEHAAVYGYGALGARLRGTLQQHAKSLWDAHRAQRDALTARLAALGARPASAAVAYRLPVDPVSPRSAADLAAALEDALVTAYVMLAGASDPALRTLAAKAMQEATARAVRWRAATGRPQGPAPAFPGLPPAALSPKPRPGD
ncbi:ferritin-like domain-containing protein [Spirillospora sp. CA-253888]